jgi:hypothetical protein
MDVKRWRADLLPNGVWEVVELAFFPDAFTYRTVVRGIEHEQAKKIAEEHNKFIT